MRPYRVYINQEALLVAPRSSQQRRAVMDFILSLASNPHARGDFTLEDEVGRTVRVKMIGRFSVTFWADHPRLRSEGHAHQSPAQVSRSRSAGPRHDFLFRLVLRDHVRRQNPSPIRIWIDHRATSDDRPRIQ